MCVGVYFEYDPLSLTRAFSFQPFDQQVDDEIFDIFQPAFIDYCEGMFRWNYHQDQKIWWDLCPPSNGQYLTIKFSQLYVGSEFFVS